VGILGGVCVVGDVVALVIAVGEAHACSGCSFLSGVMRVAAAVAVELCCSGWWLLGYSA
jgi:hypothetical protein